ncbi:hypothetical protein B723_29010 [Pseudomonas fluorescens NCIMB 11764]|uniref:Uncharacterized protein n=1 Tax=Pseudomonas fluorescens NCIMB 11764 TaxID=1221522 RepID=A0A0K1QWV1_PSEFL|nr:hypothetical protein B723_29010 [Pseudomonas fluorescens NCIMB 11764]
MPTAQNLRSAFRRGRSRSKTERGGLVADLKSTKIIGGEHTFHFCQKSLWELACQRNRPGGSHPGHGWPMASGPRSRTRARHRTKGARALGSWARFQVTCRKGTTNSRGYCGKGYIHQQPPRIRTR